MRKILQARRCL